MATRFDLHIVPSATVSGRAPYTVRPGKADCLGNVSTFYVEDRAGALIETFADNLYDPPPHDARERAQALAHRLNGR